MKISFKLIILVLILIVMGCSNSSSEEASPTPKPSPTPYVNPFPVSEDQRRYDLSGSISRLVGFDSNLMCDYESKFEHLENETATDTKGAVYVLEDEYFVSATVKIGDSEEQQVRALTQNNSLYVWTVGDNRGLQVDPASIEETSDQLIESKVSNPTQVLVQVLDEISFDCNVWENPSGEQFRLSEEVDFLAIRDYREVMEKE